MKNYVITIARGFGSGGKDIGTRLGRELGIPCYERQILTMASPLLVPQIRAYLKITHYFHCMEFPAKRVYVCFPASKCGLHRVVSRDGLSG